MTFDEWLVEECGVNNGWTFAEKEAANRAWNAAKREALRETSAWFVDKDRRDFSELIGKELK